MKFGFHTILWGRTIDDLDHVLDVVKRAAFSGVEIAQRPDRLGLRGDSMDDWAEDLATRMSQNGLDLVGLVGGSLDDRFRFAGKYAEHRAKVVGEPPRLPYLYSDESAYEKLEPLIACGARVAVHTMHPGQLAQWTDAQKLLRMDERLLWLPDTAHLTISRSDLKAALTKLPKNRLAAIHLKDWTSVYGRFSHRYARGFVELGEGEIGLNGRGLKGVLEELSGHGFDGWVIVELDYSRTSCEDSVFRCAEWLNARGYLAKPARTDSRPTTAPLLDEQATSMLVGLQSVWWPDAASGVPGFYDRAAMHLRRILLESGMGCGDIGIWEFNPARDKLAPSFAVVGVASALDTGTPDYVDAEFLAALQFSRAMQDEDVPGWFDRDPANALFAKFDADSATHLVAIPIHNQFNPHQLRFVLQILCSDRAALTAAFLRQVSMLLLRSSDAYVSERAAVAASTVNHLMTRMGKDGAEAPLTPKLFLDGLVRETQRLLRCAGVTVFMRSPGDVLFEGGTTGIEWNPDLAESALCYPLGAGFAGYVLANRQPLLVHKPGSARSTLGIIGDWRSRETESEGNGDDASARRGCLFAPMFGRDNSVIGVVRCRTKLRHGKPRLFCDDDLAVMDAILRAAVPDLELLLADERRQKAYHRMMHEVRQPVVTIENAAAEVEEEIAEQFSFNPFSQTWLEDIKLYSRIIHNVVDDFDVAELSDRPVVRSVARVYLFGDVIAPAAQLAKSLLKEKNIKFNKVDYGDPEAWKAWKIPLMYLDKARFFQVFFNLFTNAIKYARPEPKDFSVKISAAQRDSQSWSVFFEDNGVGVTPGWEEKIFQNGVRAPNVRTVHSQGLGIGLTVVRRIIGAHGGTVQLVQNSPARFEIKLPIWLTRPWRIEK